MVRVHLLPQGARIRVRRGHFPLEPSLEGREGTVLLLHRTMMGRYGVQLDDESEVRSFDESELELLSRGPTIEEAGAHRGGGGSDASS